jgi:hypothetical protein
MARPAPKKKSSSSRRPSANKRPAKPKSRRPSSKPSRKPSSRYNADDFTSSSESESSVDSYAEERERRRRHKSRGSRRSGGRSITKHEIKPHPTAEDVQQRVEEAVDASKEVEEAVTTEAVPLTKGEVEEGSGDKAEVQEALADAKQGTTIQAADILEGGGEEEEAGEDADSLRSAASDRGSSKRQVGQGGDYGAAYKELYTNLYIRMVDRIYRFFRKLYVKCGNNEAKFKKKLYEIPSWNQTQIEEKSREFIKAHPSIVQYFKFAYAANVMLMSVVVQRDENSRDLSVDVPKFTEFVHRCYSESARSIYDCAAVLDPSLPAEKRLGIREELYTCFGNAIGTSLRIMVPLEKISAAVEGKEEDDEEGKMGGLDDFGDFGDSSEEEEETEEATAEQQDASGLGKLAAVGSTSRLSAGESESEDSEEESEGSDDSDGSEEEDSGSEEEDSEEEEEEAPPRRRHRQQLAPRANSDSDELTFY